MQDTSLNEFIHDFVSERSNIGAANATYDPLYIKTSKEVSGLFNQIRQLLDKNEQLIFNYENASNLLEAIAIDYSYKQGFRDGIALLNELGCFLNISREKEGVI